MQREVITITLRWPNDSFGFDISQIHNCLDDFIKNHSKGSYSFDCGSGRKLKLERKKESKCHTMILK